MSLHGKSVEQYPLGKTTPEGERELSALALNTFEGLRSFWMPIHDDGEKLEAVIGGDFYTSEMKAEAALQKKHLISIPEGYPKFVAMVGSAILSMKGGGIVAQGPEDALDAEGANIVSTTIDNEVDMLTLRAFCVRDAYATGCPQFLLLDKPHRNMQGKTLHAFRPSWRMGYIDQLCRDTSKLSDCRVVGFQHLPNKSDLLRKYPHRKNEIEQAFSGVSTFGENQESGLTANERSVLLTSTEAGKSQIEQLGRVVMVELFSLIPQVVTVYASPKSEKPFLRPQDWNDQQFAMWQQENPDYQPLQMEVDILWVTSVLLTGQVMENRPHWFQEGKFPLACLVLQWHREKPVSPLKFAMQNWKLQAIAKTEHLHSIRMATDGLTLIREGAVKNEADLNWELTRPGGRIIVKRGTALADAIHRLPNQREQVAWADVFAEAQMTNDRLTVDRNMEGGAQSSQEAGKVFQLRIAQMQNKTAQVQMALDSFTREIEDIKLKMLPYVLTEEQEIRYIDEKNGRKEQKSLVVNEVVERDFLGEPLKYRNRIESAKFDLVATSTDDSVTGREAELQAFVLIMSQAMQSVPPDMWADVLGEFPNSIAQRVTSNLRKRAEEAAKQPNKPPVKISATVDASKIAFDPVARAVAEQAGILPPSAPNPEVALGQPQPGAIA